MASSNLALAERHTPTLPRRAAFLEALARHGTIAAASRAVCPPALLERGSDGRSAWINLKRRDPAFAVEVETALQSFVDGLHERARQLAMGEIRRDVRFQGEVVGTEQIISENVLLRLLERHDANWAVHRKYEHRVHTDSAGEPGLLVKLDEVEKLSPEHRAALFEICNELQKMRRADAATDVTPPAEDDDAYSLERAAVEIF